VHAEVAGLDVVALAHRVGEGVVGLEQGDGALVAVGEAIAASAVVCVK
jgi:hypothetical protein